MSAPRRLRVDPTRCRAYGFCAELVPERVSLDEWGYPIVEPTPLPAALVAAAQRASTFCPRLALTLARVDNATTASGDQ